MIICVRRYQTRLLMGFLFSYMFTVGIRYKTETFLIRSVIYKNEGTHPISFCCTLLSNQICISYGFN